MIRSTTTTALRFAKNESGIYIPRLPDLYPDFPLPLRKLHDRKEESEAQKREDWAFPKREEWRFPGLDDLVIPGAEPKPMWFI